MEESHEETLATDSSGDAASQVPRDKLSEYFLCILLKHKIKEATLSLFLNKNSRWEEPTEPDTALCN